MGMSPRALIHGRDDIMAGLVLAERQLPQSASSTFVNKSSSTTSLRTYSKHPLQDTFGRPGKRQRIELPTTHIHSSTKSGVQQPTTQASQKKRSISQYFKPATHINPPSSPQPSIFSSDPIENVKSSPSSSPPSSPPPQRVSPSRTTPRKRPRRRLFARAPLALIKMSDLNAGGSKEHGKFKGKAIDKGLADPEDSSRALHLAEASEQGSRQVARVAISQEEVEDDRNVGRGVPAHHLTDDIPRSAPIDIPGARNRSVAELLLALVPHRPNTSRGAFIPPPNPMASSRNLSFGSQDTLVGDLTEEAEVSFGSAETVVATHQPIRDLIPSSGSPASHGLLLQSHVAGPSGTQISAQSAITGVTQSNIPTANNAARGTGNLVQAQLDIGPQAILTCRTCRFTWNRTIPADIRAHDEYHDAHILGEPVIGLMTTPRYQLASINTRIGQGDSVVMVDRSSTDGWKRLALTVLENHVDRELGSIKVDPGVLWSSIADPAARGPVANQVDRFKVYMYVRRWVPRLGRVVSLLLAERIRNGFETNRIQLVADEFGPWPAEVPQTQTVVSEQAHEAVLGINKFWTLRSCRRHGFGKLLMDYARKTFVRSYNIPRVHIAWTHTTDDGARFAKAYLEDQAEYEFLTYDDQI